MRQKGLKMYELYIYMYCIWLFEKLGNNLVYFNVEATVLYCTQWYWIPGFLIVKIHTNQANYEKVKAHVL